MNLPALASLSDTYLASIFDMAASLAIANLSGIYLVSAGDMASLTSPDQTLRYLLIIDSPFYTSFAST